MLFLILKISPHLCSRESGAATWSIFRTFSIFGLEGPFPRRFVCGFVP